METTEIIQLIAWITALVEFIMGLYILLLNFRHSANRHVSLLLLLFAINTYAQGKIIAGEDLPQIEGALLLLAATTPAIQPGLLLVAIILLKPQWLQKRSKINLWLLYGMVALPIVLTIIDHFFHTNIWYSGYQGEHHPGAFINLQSFTQGSMGAFLRILFLYGITIFTLFPLAYIAILDKSITKLTRRLAITLLATQTAAILINLILFFSIGTYLGVLITSTIFALGYTYAAFWQFISERRLQSGRLEIRLTALILAITIPLMVSTSIYILEKTQKIIQQTNISQVESLRVSLDHFQISAFIFIGIGILLLGALTTLTIRQAVQPIKSLTLTAVAISQGDLSRVAPLESDDEIGILAQSFNQMTEQLLELIGTLEKRVSERTTDLERRSSQLQAAADVARVASSVLDINLLFDEIVGVIRDRFNLYYVGLFQLDEDREWAYLRAGTGMAGKKMLARSHRIRIGRGMIGWAIANAQPRIAREAQADLVRLATDELPDTRSEAAIPLKVRGRVIGAISVQDTHPEAFDDLSIATLQTMADLVSIAIDNARLYTESQEALETSRRAYGDSSNKAWQEQAQKKLSFQSNKGGSSQMSLDNGIETDSGNFPLRLPVTIRGKEIGEIIAKKPASAGNWLREEVSILEVVASQLGVALESARLYEETQQRGTFERITREVSTHIRQSLDMDTVIRIAAAEFKRALDLSEVEIRMGRPDEHPHN